MRDEIRSEFEGKTQVFEDNGGGLCIVGQRKDGSFEYCDGLQMVDNPDGLYDLTHIDEFQDPFDGDIDKVLEDLYNCLDASQHVEPTKCVAEYDHKTKKVTCYPELMGFTARSYLGLDLRGLCKKAVEAGYRPSDAGRLIEMWEDINENLYESEVRDEMERLIRAKLADQKGHVISEDLCLDETVADFLASQTGCPASAIEAMFDSQD